MKIFLWTCFLLLLGLAVRDHYSSIKTIFTLTESLTDADLEIGRARSRVLSLSDLEKEVGRLEEVVQADTRKQRAQVTLIGDLRAELKRSRSSSQRGRITKGKSVSCEKAAPGEIYQASSAGTLSLVKTLSAEMEDYRIKISCQISPLPEKVNSTIFYDLSLRLRGELVETVLPTGDKNTYFSLWEVDSEGIDREKLELTKFEIKRVDLSAPSFQWWVPKLDIGLNFSTEVSAGLGLSLSGYGGRELSWRFVRVSVDTDGFGLTPALYNLGEILPLISNVWIGPRFSRSSGSLTITGVL